MIPFDTTSNCEPEPIIAPPNTYMTTLKLDLVTHSCHVILGAGPGPVAHLGWPSDFRSMPVQCSQLESMVRIFYSACMTGI